MMRVNNYIERDEKKVDSAIGPPYIEGVRQEEPMIHSNQTVDEGNYLRFVANAANLPHDFVAAHAERISLAYKMGETPEMIAEELKLRYSLRRPMPTKSPRTLASRVVRI
jgi:hypothetical protein